MVGYAVRAIAVVLFLCAVNISAQSVAPDSSRWQLEGEAKAVEYQGRKALSISGGSATLKDLQLRDGVIELPPALRVLDGGVEGGLGDADAEGSDADAAAVEHAQGVDETVAFFTV